MAGESNISIYVAVVNEVLHKAQAGDLSAFQAALATLEGIFDTHHRELKNVPAPGAVLRRAAREAAYADNSEVVLYLCRDRGVYTHAFLDHWDSAQPDGLDTQTPLSVAIGERYEDLALQLLAIPQPPGKEPTKGLIKTVSGETYGTLHWAAAYNAARVVEALVMKYGMDMNVQDSQAFTALDQGVMKGSVAAARFLLQKQREVGGLEQALKRDWVNKATGIGFPGKNGPCLLYLATFRKFKDRASERIDLEGFEQRQLSMVRLLVEEFGAGVTASASDCAFHNSAHGGKLLLCKYFMETCGRPVDEPSPVSLTYGWTPLHWACFCPGGPEQEKRNLVVVEYLVAHGASLSVKAGGMDALEMAQLAGNQQIHRYLMAHRQQRLQRRRQLFGGEKQEKEKEKEVDAAAAAAAEAAAEAARASLLAELDAEEEKEKEKGGKKKSGGGGGGGGGGSGISGKKKKNNNNNKNKNKGGAAAGVGAAAAAAGGGDGGTGQAAAAATTAAVERSMEGLDLGDDEGKEQGRAAAKAEAEAEEEEEEEEEGPALVDAIQDEESFILEGAPNEFFCPITTALLGNPCVAGDGVTYDEHAIKEWFETCRRKGNEITSPKTGAKMADMTMPNTTLMTLVKDFVDKRKQEWKRKCAEKEASQKKKGKK